MRIGDLATRSGLTTKTIRYYEQAGLMPEPPRTSSGYRDYPPAAEARLAFIRDAQHAGLTLAEIRGILALRDGGEAPCGHVTDLIHQHLEEINRRMAELRKTRTVLRDLARQAAEADPQSCSDADNICRIISPQQGGEP
ncbi:heavy metal-responsive transcriptional regulator [Streptomyces anulatus]|uniref:heavy metal-responsive transcriptional regulator n=1 Tax=Streptomyces anulatus TaxID=1892 RepID=UPI0036B009D1